MGGSLPNLVLLVTISSPARVKLSPLEWRVLRLVTLGCNRRQIAGLLDQTVEAVGRCQVDLKRKAQATTLRALARWARQMAICPPDDRLSTLERARLCSFEQPIESVL